MKMQNFLGFQSLLIFDKGYWPVEGLVQNCAAVGLQQKFPTARCKFKVQAVEM